MNSSFSRFEWIKYTICYVALPKAIKFNEWQYNVINCIINQEEHHRIKTFPEEYLGMLKKFEIEYKDEYVFEFYKD